jgi:tetratricopeptide (TPR) repeat protein
MGVALIRAALDLARREQVVAGEIMPLNNLAAMQLYRDLPAARRAAAEGIAVARRHGERTNEAWVACNLAFACWLDGSWQELERVVEEHTSTGTAETLLSQISQLPLTMARTARGLPSPAPDLRVLQDSGDVSGRVFAWLEEALAAFEQQQLEHAADLAAKATDGYREYGSIEDDYPLFWVPGIEFALAAGRLSEAHRLFNQVAETPKGLVPQYLLAQLHRMRGLLAVAEGDDAAAEPELAQAIEALRAFGAPFYAARAQLELAELLTRAGRSAEARAQADAALAAFTDLGATPWAERATTTANLASV